MFLFLLEYRISEVEIPACVTIFLNFYRNSSEKFKAFYCKFGIEFLVVKCIKNFATYLNFAQTIRVTSFHLVRCEVLTVTSKTMAVF
jgi:hypothetical protein